MSAFYPDVRATTLIPGDADTLRGVATQFDTLSTGFSAAENELRSIDSGSWKGDAANAFRHALDQQPGQYSLAANALSESAGALRSYAGTLEAAQDDASVAISVWEEAERETAAWQAQRQAAPSHHVTTSTVDPGESGRARANSILQAAQADVRAAAAGLGAKLEAAARSAPRKPSLAGELVLGAEHVGRELLHYEGVILKSAAEGELWIAKEEGKVLLDIGKLELNVARAAVQIALDPSGWSTTLPRLTEQFVAGVVAGTEGIVMGVVDIGEAAWDVSPARMVIDPAGWSTSVSDAITDTKEIGTYAIEHPAAFASSLAKNMVNAKEWKDDPAKAIGELVPAVILGVVTAGAGDVADGAGAAADAFDSMSDEAALVGDWAGAATLDGEAAEASETAEEFGTVARDLQVVGDLDDIDGVAQAAQGKPQHEADGHLAGDVGEDVEPELVDDTTVEVDDFIAP